MSEIKILLILFLFPFYAEAQNLIPNPSFEAEAPEDENADVISFFAQDWQGECAGFLRYGINTKNHFLQKNPK